LRKFFLLKHQLKNFFERGQVLLINKPFHWTSFGVVRKIRTLADVKKVGHAGTLDPLATGLLILCTGVFTKRIHEFMAQEKEYTGTFIIGATTATYDLESEPENVKDISGITNDLISSAVKKLTGEILQTPPVYSAIKKDGKRAYDMARQGKEIILDARKTTIKEFEITEIELPVIHFRVVCTTGTYIRSLAKDFGDLLGCGAYLGSLCRTRIGAFTLDNSMNMEEAEKFILQKLPHQKG
jgi:tRNA pseudouridine55 synthase